MNSYGARVMSHYQQWCPTRYSEIPNPERHFTMLGEQIQADVGLIAQQIAGSDLPDETYLEKVGRLNVARMQAEEIVLADLLPAPEEENDPQDDNPTPGTSHWFEVQAVRDRQLDAEARDREWEEWERQATPPNV